MVNGFAAMFFCDNMIDFVRKKIVVLVETTVFAATFARLTTNRRKASGI